MTDEMTGSVIDDMKKTLQHIDAKKSRFPIMHNEMMIEKIGLAKNDTNMTTLPKPVIKSKSLQTDL
ncbi:MAG: hypothetical protein ACOZBL_02910 [Patescibacteria group bacterium]